MIVLNECRINDTGKCLIVEASVKNLSYYDDVYIEAIIIDTDSTYSANGPSNNPIFIKLFDTDEKSVTLNLNYRELGLANLNDNVFFIYVIAKGVPAPDTPCGLDNKTTIGIAVNLRPVFNHAMAYINETMDSCSIPKSFIDMILKFKAFEVSLRTGNFEAAVKFWKKLSTNKVEVSLNSTCGCNGTKG